MQSIFLLATPPLRQLVPSFKGLHERGKRTKAEGGRVGSADLLACVEDERSSLEARPGGQLQDVRTGRSRSRPRTAWNKGLRASELTKRKISLAQKRRHSEAPALRAGVRAKLQGKEPWNKGKQMNAATCAKMAAAKAGRRHSRATRRLMSQSHTSLSHSPETCAALSAKLSGMPKAPEHAAAIAASQRRRHVAARVLRAVEGVHAMAAAPATLQLPPATALRRGGPGAGKGLGGTLSGGTKRAERAQRSVATRAAAAALDAYKAELREFRTLQGELAPWTSAFRDKHARKPRLADVEGTGIPWLVSRFKQYVVLRERLLTDTQGLRSRLGNAVHGAAPSAGETDRGGAMEAATEYRRRRAEAVSAAARAAADAAAMPPAGARGMRKLLQRAVCTCVEVLQQRREALEKGSACRHAILVAGVGFYTDAYDLFVIGLVKPMIGVLYYPELNGKLGKSDDLWVTGVALVGTLVGQVFFGVCGDYLGRKRIYLVTLVIMIVATIGQALAASPIRGWGMLTEICIWRFILGFGIGGDYPLSASIASEYASTKWRGAFVGSVFAMQGFGILSAAVVSVITIACFHYPIVHMDINYLDYVWRIIIGFGAIPCVLTIYLRATIPETPRYSQDVERNEAKALRNVAAVKAGQGNFVDEYTVAEQCDRISWKKLNHYLTYPSILRNRNFWVLVGTASTWFLLDIAFYSQNLFLPNILEGIGYNPSLKLPIASAPCAKTHSCTVYDQQFNPQYKCTGACAEKVYDKMFKTAAGSAITACMGTVPGYWFTVAFVDTIGRVNIQYMGFTIMTTILIILAAAFTQIKAVSIWLFIVMYALTFFFANFGPNATTFITPVELFTTKYRSTLHGISAACGKAGAIVGAFGFGELVLNAGIQRTLAILAITNFLGLLCTVFVPETKRIDLDDAALHSTSHFGKFLKSRGIEQVNPAIADSLNDQPHNGDAAAVRADGKVPEGKVVD
ncbi:hypothetical protein WJX81_002681 [Elliptochloris bilobata]|uniref:Major facilitator superfamily (MFS) profile domain-containing protein n=1 Tax=Elliptochloris bilobata TaxID=381761 RepID=A0AAW1SJN3_9CHLO